MFISDCIQFANEHPVCYLATLDGDQPHVRGFMLWYADRSGFYFHTADCKSVYHQLKINPKLEVCFFSAPERYPDLGTTLRVSGRIKFIDDPQIKQKLLDDRPFLKELASGSDGHQLVIFCLYTGSAMFWKVENNLREAEGEKIQF